MALNVHVTRINGNPSFTKRASTATSLSHPHVVYVQQHPFDWPTMPQNHPSATTLINVPEDRNICKFPVRIFEMPDEE